MGNDSSKQCKKHQLKARTCNFVRIVYRIDRKCDKTQQDESKQPNFDSIYDEISSKENKLYEYLNACNHVMKFHFDDLSYINAHMSEKKTNQKCTLDTCIMLKRNYAQQYTDQTIIEYINNTTERCSDKHDYSDLRQMIFFQSVDSMHEYLYHSQNDRAKRNRIQQINAAYHNNQTLRYVGINDCIQDQTDSSENISVISPKASATTLCVTDGESELESMSGMSASSAYEMNTLKSRSNSNAKAYVNGRGWIYDSKKKHKSGYVGCKHENLQQELHEECKLSKRGWTGFIMKAKQLAQTEEIKRIRHRNIRDKPLSTIRVLILWIYTSYESFQRKLNELARETSNVSQSSRMRAAKKRHSTFGHSFKMLKDTVTDYGSNAGEDGLTTVFRGIGILPLFSKYLLMCNSPCSTSVSMAAASNFAGEDIGCVLEFDVPRNSTYFNMQYISAYKLEAEMLFYGKHSWLCMERLHCNVGTYVIDMTPMVLLEMITTPRTNEKHYRNMQEYGQRNVLAQGKQCQLVLSILTHNYKHSEMEASEEKSSFSDLKASMSEPVMNVGNSKSSISKPNCVPVISENKSKSSLSKPVMCECKSEEKCASMCDLSKTESVSLTKEFDYWVSKKRMIVLKDATLMKLLRWNQGIFDEKYLGIFEIISVFNETRYLTIDKAYKVGIECVKEFCVNDTAKNNLKTGVRHKLRQIELFHAWNEDELNGVKRILGDMWTVKDCVWEPFYDEYRDLITFKKDVTTFGTPYVVPLHD